MRCSLGPKVLELRQADLAHMSFMSHRLNSRPQASTMTIRIEASMCANDLCRGRVCSRTSSVTTDSVARHSSSDLAQMWPLGSVESSFPSRCCAEPDRAWVVQPFCRIAPRVGGRQHRRSSWGRVPWFHSCCREIAAFATCFAEAQC